MKIRRKCADFEETKAHDRHAAHRGAYAGDSAKMTKWRKRKTNRRERREGKRDNRNEE